MLGFADMSRLNETVTNFLFPANLRPYCTFRNATVLALLITVATPLVRVFVKFPPAQVAQWQSQNLFQSPLFLSLYYVSVAIVLWLVYATRHRATWYVWRVWV